MQTILRFDFYLLDAIRNHFKCAALDVLMPYISRLADHGFIWIVTAAFLLCIKKQRKNGIALTVALLLCLLLGNLTLKPLIERIRPFALQSVPLLIQAPTDFSFPSGHTLSSFAAATVLLYADRRFGIPAFIYAALVGFSRLYLYVHFPTDVFAGAVLGVCIGLLSILLTIWLRRLLARHRALGG